MEPKSVLLFVFHADGTLSGSILEPTSPKQFHSSNLLILEHITTPFALNTLYFPLLSWEWCTLQNVPLAILEKYRDVTCSINREQTLKIVQENKLIIPSHVMTELPL